MIIHKIFRLQCPQTHAGLVVAFSGTTLSPITDSHVQFKWYRQGSDNEHLIPIDEGTRGWYPPTADDIGKKISVNCQDTLDEGYCRYTEVCMSYQHMKSFHTYLILIYIHIYRRLVQWKRTHSCVRWWRLHYKMADAR